MAWTHFHSRCIQFSFALSVFQCMSGWAEKETQPQHLETGTSYGCQGVHTYATMKHGADGTLFLDPYFLPYLSNLEGQVLLDAGCGAGPWSIIAAQNGALVYGIDIQEGMIQKATEASFKASVAERVHFEVGDVENLPYPSAFFDRAISLNVGCNLPDLKAHLQELHRVLKPGGIAVITAPTSFGTVFTDGKKIGSEEISSIQHFLIQNQDSFPNALKNLEEVYRATFVKDQDQWTLLLDESKIESGALIWRKIPGMVVPNYYHSEKEYLSLLNQTHFRIHHVYHPHFMSEQARQSYNENNIATLGEEYTDFSPFVIFIVQK